jgi:hypothetical protein
VRNVVYRIHDKNSLKIRKARYGRGPQGNLGKIAGAAAAASIALFLAPNANAAEAASPKEQVARPEPGKQATSSPEEKKKQHPDQGSATKFPDLTDDGLLPPQS